MTEAQIALFSGEKLEVAKDSGYRTNDPDMFPYTLSTSMRLSENIMNGGITQHPRSELRCAELSNN